MYHLKVFFKNQHVWLNHMSYVISLLLILCVKFILSSWLKMKLNNQYSSLNLHNHIFNGDYILLVTDCIQNYNAWNVKLLCFSLPDMRDSYANSMRGRPPEFYERHLVAEYNGERAGSCVLRYHGDSELFQ